MERVTKQCDDRDRTHGTQRLPADPGGDPRRNQRPAHFVAVRPLWTWHDRWCLNFIAPHTARVLTVIARMDKHQQRGQSANLLEPESNINLQNIPSTLNAPSLGAKGRVHIDEAWSFKALGCEVCGYFGHALEHEPSPLRRVHPAARNPVSVHHQASVPPSTRMSVALMKLLSSEARNTAAAATSSGLPNSPRMIRPFI